MQISFWSVVARSRTCARALQNSTDSVLLCRARARVLLRYSVDLERAFYYVPRPLIDRALRNDVTYLTTYTMHTHASDTRIYIYIYIYIKPRGKQS